MLPSTSSSELEGESDLYKTVDFAKRELNFSDSTSDKHSICSQEEGLKQEA